MTETINMWINDLQFIRSLFKPMMNPHKLEDTLTDCASIQITQTELWSGSKRVVNFPWKSLQRSRENCSLNFGYRFERQTARKTISSFEKHCVLDLECGIYLRNLQISAFCISMSYFKISKLKKISIDSW